MHGTFDGGERNKTEPRCGIGARIRGSVKSGENSMVMFIVCRPTEGDAVKSFIHVIKRICEFEEADESIFAFTWLIVFYAEAEKGKKLTYPNRGELAVGWWSA